MGGTAKGKISNATDCVVWFKIKNSYIQVTHEDQTITHNAGSHAGLNYGTKSSKGRKTKKGSDEDDEHNSQNGGLNIGAKYDYGNARNLKKIRFVTEGSVRVTPHSCHELTYKG